MFKIRPHSIFILLLFLLFSGVTNAADPRAHCDSLVQSGIDAMWKKDHVKSLELLTEARTIAQKNHWYKQLFLATNNIGANYYALLDYGEALNHYLESYTIAVKHLEPKYEMVVLNNIAILYSKEEDHEKATEYFKKAYSIAKENKDLFKTGLYAMNLGNVANEMRSLKEARDYFKESLPYLKDNEEMLLLAEMGLAENDLLAGHAQLAREKATALFSKLKDPNFNDTGLSLSLIITRSYIKEDNFAKAVAEAQKILDTKPNADVKRTVYSLLSETYTKSREYDKALQYKDSVIWGDKELNKIKNGEVYQTNRVKFEIQDYKNQIAINSAKLNSERKLFYYILAVIIAVVTIIVLVLRNISVKNRQKQLEAEHNEKEMALQLEKEKNENLLLEQQIKEKETTALLEQERLKNEIEARNRKLSAKALYLSGRNELIEDILSSVSGTTELSKNPELAGHIKTLKSHLKTNDEWDSFLTHFEEVNQGFLNRLKTAQPMLTGNDIRFITYIYMNLSTKEIASMLNITPEACRKRKERLAAKMELPANMSLYDYLSFL
ncbi:tetratricopeptide repeat protein [Flavobacterium sp. Sd200]|uniref:tetratricopeptide repeat protein n=1 Tax=Flavobacterium sp. Sd200 TaxID=2692211 RepID=UPI00136C2763|nr:tetratricopeptide repeat protein [Flavobacterium sp. Sd200]MXN92792.1 tetratricopeptide repeat protein [Flavobacterium sp. Sd200]